jgi:hypothetical protein
MFSLNTVLYGDPAGRELWFFEPEPGSNVQATSFVDEALTIPHPNPVVADANGQFPPVYLDMTKRVEARLKDSRGRLLLTHSDALKDSRGRLLLTHSDARQLCGPQIRCHECGALMRKEPIS